MHLRTRIISFFFIPAIIVVSTHNNKWNHTQNRTEPDTPDIDTGVDFDFNLGRDLTDLFHGSIPDNATGTGSDSTEERFDDYEIEAGENKNGTEIYIFLCRNRRKHNLTNASATTTTINKDTGRIRVPLWLRAPMEEYKMDAISPNFALPLFNFRVKEGRLLDTRGCGHPNRVKRYGALLKETHRKTHFDHAMTGELREYDSIEEQSAHWTDYFTHKGYFKEKNFYYHPQHYCIHTITDTELELDLCPPQEGVDLIVNKCCPLGSVVRTNPYEQPFYGTGCVETVTEWEPVVPKSDGGSEKSYPYYRHVIIHCDNAIDGLIPNEKLPIHGISKADIQLQRTGEVLSRATGNEKWDKPKYDRTRYIGSVCIDGVIADTSFYPEYAEYKIVGTGIGNASGTADLGMNTDYVKGTFFNSNDTYKEEEKWTVIPDYVFLHENQVLLFCPNETANNEEKQQQVFTLMYITIYCIASPFTFVTFLVYLLMARRQNVHGWTKAGFSFAWLIHSISMSIAHAAFFFQHREIILFRSTVCITVAIINHFGYIAQFSWLTVLNFDLWHTISSKVPIKDQPTGFRRFVCYCAFGFGVPTAVVVTSVVLETNYGLFDERVIRPQYGHVSCAIVDTAYFHLKLLPALFLYMINVLFIALTCQFLYQFQKSTARVKSNLKSTRSQTRLFGKLFILMGVSWLSDIISGLFVGLEWSWYIAIFDIWNIIQSILLFWIFVCKKEIKDQLCMSYKPFKYVWDLWERKQCKQKPAPSLFFFGSFLQGGVTHHTPESRMQYIRLARLRSFR